MQSEGSRTELYRTRAREVRALAEGCRDDTIRQQLLIVAAEYETLALQAADARFSRY